MEDASTFETEKFQMAVYDELRRLSKPRSSSLLKRIGGTTPSGASTGPASINVKVSQEYKYWQKEEGYWLDELESRKQKVLQLQQMKNEFEAGQLVLTRRERAKYGLYSDLIEEEIELLMKLIELQKKRIQSELVTSATSPEINAKDFLKQLLNQDINETNDINSLAPKEVQVKVRVAASRQNREVSAKNSDADNIEAAKKLVNRKDIQMIICPALQSISDDAFEIAKVITPLLSGLAVAGVLAIPLIPSLFAAIALVVARMGVASLCNSQNNKDKIENK